MMNRKYKLSIRATKYLMYMINMEYCVYNMVRYTKYIDSYNIYVTNCPLRFYLHRWYEYLVICEFYANLQP